MKKNLNTKLLKITNYTETSFKTYMKEVNKIALMKPDEEFKVGMEAMNGNEDALMYLIKANLRFVISVAKQYTNKNHPIEDLVNEGNIGLIIAAQRFDPTKGFKFITYAVWWIRRTIQEYKNGSSEFIKKPNNHLIILNKVNNVKNRLENELEREPTNDEIIDAMDGLDNLDMVSYISQQNVQSLDKEIGEDGFSLNDVIYNKSNIQIKEDKDELKYKINKMLNKLNSTERKVIELSYGLSGEQPMSLQEIGNIVNRTRESVRQVKLKALYKLKRNTKKHGLNFENF